MDAILAVADGPLNFSFRSHRAIIGMSKRIAERSFHRSSTPACRRSKADDAVRCFASVTTGIRAILRFTEQPVRRPWGGMTRLEFSAALGIEAVISLADALTVRLPRFAGVAHCDSHTPRNLFSIGEQRTRFLATQVVLGQAQVAKDSTECTDRNVTRSVNRNGGHSPVIVPHDSMRTVLSNDRKTALGQSAQKFVALHDSNPSARCSEVWPLLRSGDRDDLHANVVLVARRNRDSALAALLKAKLDNLTSVAKRRLDGIAPGVRLRQRRHDHVVRGAVGFWFEQHNVTMRHSRQIGTSGSKSLSKLCNRYSEPLEAKMADTIRISVTSRPYATEPRRSRRGKGGFARQTSSTRQLQRGA